MVLTKEQRQELVKSHRRHEKDSGSPEVQVALLTERINYLSGHVQTHPQDHHSRRGLLTMVERRKRLLKYLQREDRPRYEALIQRLNLRK